jgi:hypothetical protein
VATIGSLAISMELQSAALLRGLDRVSASVGSFQRTVGRHVRVVQTEFQGVQRQIGNVRTVMTGLLAVAGAGSWLAWRGAPWMQPAGSARWRPPPA